MNVRNILVVASAAAILAGTSFGALAGSWGVSKGHSASSIHVVAKAYPQDNDIEGFGFGGGWWQPKPQSIVTVDGHGYQSASAPNGGSAGASSSTWGGGVAASVGVNLGYVGGQGTVAAAFGGTSGSACAGSACDSD